jgi:microcystin-dependent protein
VEISDYDTLFNLIGTTYGGDGQETFALPDLQSRVPVHQGSGYVLASTGGAETVTLNQGQLPVHSHPLNASGAAASATSPSGNVWAQWNDSPYSTAQPSVTMAAAALSAAGGGQAHDNMPPFLALNFIISLFGIYPSPT